MYAAAETQNRYLAFMSLISTGEMFSEISSKVSIGRYDVLAGYDSRDLHRTALMYDEMLNEYLKEYKRAGIQVKHYADIDAFALDYVLNIDNTEEQPKV